MKLRQIFGLICILLFFSAGPIRPAQAQSKSAPLAPGIAQAAGAGAAQTPVPGAAKTPDNAKKFEAALSLAQNLSQWALAILAGSLLILVGTSYYRPKRRKFRLMYFLFVPGWICLGISMYKGSLVQRDYLGWLFRNASDAVTERATTTLTSDAFSQIYFLEWAVVVFGVWLFFYMLWWILADIQENTASEDRV